MLVLQYQWSGKKSGAIISKFCSVLKESKGIIGNSTSEYPTSPEFCRCEYSYLGVPTGGDHLEADISEGVEDDHRVGANTDPVTGLLGRGAAGVAGSSRAVELGLRVSKHQHGSIFWTIRSDVLKKSRNPQKVWTLVFFDFLTLNGSLQKAFKKSPFQN